MTPLDWLCLAAVGVGLLGIVTGWIMEPREYMPLFFWSFVMLLAGASGLIFL